MLNNCFTFVDYNTDLDFSGKIQALLATTKEQRREYKAKFVDMDVEFARMRERLETMNLILDDIQVNHFYFYLSLGTGILPTLIFAKYGTLVQYYLEKVQ